MQKPNVTVGVFVREYASFTVEAKPTTTKRRKSMKPLEALAGLFVVLWPFAALWAYYLTTGRLLQF